MDLAGGTRGKDPTAQCRRHWRLRFDPWVGKITWRRAWKPVPVLLRGESPGQKSLEGCSLWGPESDMTETIYHGTRTALCRFCDAKDIYAHVICPTLLSSQLFSSLSFFSFYEEVRSTLHSP